MKYIHVRTLQNSSPHIFTRIDRLELVVKGARYGGTFAATSKTSGTSSTPLAYCACSSAWCSDGMTIHESMGIRILRPECPLVGYPRPLLRTDSLLPRAYGPGECIISIPAWRVNNGRLVVLEQICQGTGELFSLHPGYPNVRPGILQSEGSEGHPLESQR